MINARIARRYAKALLAIGSEDGQADKYKEELAAFVAVLEDHEELESALCNPLYDRKSRKKVLLAILERMKPSEIMSSFLSLLFDKGRIRHVKDIYSLYEKLSDELSGVVRADVVSAVALSDDVISKIRDALAKKTEKKVTVETSVDPELIGGVITKIGDLVLDGSVRSQLIGIKESLQRGEGS